MIKKLLTGWVERNAVGRVWSAINGRHRSDSSDVKQLYNSIRVNRSNDVTLKQHGQGLILAARDAMRVITWHKWATHSEIERGVIDGMLMAEKRLRTETLKKYQNKSKIWCRNNERGAVFSANRARVPQWDGLVSGAGDDCVGVGKEFDTVHRICVTTKRVATS